MWGRFFLEYVAPVVDVLFVAAIIGGLIMLAKGTRAWQILMGLFVFGFIYVLSDLLHFRTLFWLLRQIVPLAPLALVILFYPELRYFLEEMGRVQFWRHRLRLTAPRLAVSAQTAALATKSALTAEHGCRVSAASGPRRPSR